MSAGTAWKVPWIELTPKEQKLVSVGSIGFITAAICGGSFGIACGIASAVGAAAQLWVGEHGPCPNNKRMLVETTWSGQLRGGACR